MISSEQKRKVKERAVTELERYAAIAIYLWVLFSLFEIHRVAVLRGVNGASLSGYRIVLAAVNALIMGKVIIIGEVLRIGERLGQGRLIVSALYKSAMFGLLAVFFNVIEGEIEGLIHGRSIVASIPRLAGGGLEGMILYGVMAFVVLIPFFLFSGLQQSLGKERLHALILQKRSRADAA